MTKYEYDNRSRLMAVMYSWTKEKSGVDRKEAEEAGLHFWMKNRSKKQKLAYSNPINS